MKRLRIFIFALFALSLLITLDLWSNYSYNLVPLDGSISALHSVTHRLFGIFGDHSWSAARFYNAFIVSAAASAALGVANLVLLLPRRKQKAV
ncbi:MAG TPA: hypothetical protein IAD33_02215 [Candidatus Scatomorpha gallistercoris]|nr:hypothetical protein [Candidatus Scatomorpha gallistercoris]